MKDEVGDEVSEVEYEVDEVECGMGEVEREVNDVSEVEDEVGEVEDEVECEVEDEMDELEREVDEVEREVECEVDEVEREMGEVELEVDVVEREVDEVEREVECEMDEVEREMGEVELEVDVVEREVEREVDEVSEVEDKVECEVEDEVDELKREVEHEVENLSSVSDCETLSISGSVVQLADQVKSLGVIVDSRLSFDAQISSICKASYFHIKALRKIRSALDMETAKTVACSIVTSRIDYCNSLFYGMTARNFSKPQRIQNTVARIVSGNRRFDHITPVLKELHWLPVRERVDFKIGCMTFKALRNKQPTYLSDVLLRIPFRKSAAARRSFCFAVPTIWNSLKSSTRDATSIGTFKTRLKTELFNSGFH